MNVRSDRSRILGFVCILALGCSLAVVGSPASTANASNCSTTTGAASCTITANLTVSAGTLSLISSPSLYWGMVVTGYDQWASGSGSALTGCGALGSLTHCSSGTAPLLEVLDATGSASGWSISEYLSASSLPSGSVLTFNGAGSSTYGWSQVSPISTNPFAGTTPANSCDFGSTCTTATPASTCSHVALGYSTCPTSPVTLGGSGPTAQVNLYSAASATGLGAVCFATGTATATSCASTTAAAFYNLGVKGSTATGTYTATINMAVNSGP
ncbi:MAG: hypothetical protein JWL72_2944 [Ilumatobacteraceae bacterium]|nr:hypothetical protein [Ilumatobacteraceae bacterium]MCU1389606.1 hypothetical protein [Ilumatobacteraceae bacterium]